MDKFTKALILMLVGICVADIATTTYILYLGGRELNIFMVSVASDAYVHTMVKMVFAAAIAISTYCTDQLIKGSGILCPLVASCIIGYAVINNIVILYQKGYIQLLV